ncbi:OPSD-like protein [Mya arenaria]|uniref:OPSD-like protein n=1 Tax=Mya arenaria TaxID=6604 RepID=A0ABY7F774_MYAAR|nr:rhodopsin, GQ-coupled-like [Mya arenaria]XP_052765785.1 rhodopsin, GQ-coupled-like [Mya arenaria]XP_052765786.1 rhodopsin, GQ-coupled-like [Mya arenaria]XP_052765788.1 rhodopsin, GQ-coupled-like [Mya arenaria]XP_052765789.1 rhodopsin, GQ-coupled-like [Mya arenaria]WAR18052.1 OPSD-like protein [Mya arenaria]
MYSAIPKDWRQDFDVNVTIQELNDSLAELHVPTIAFIALLMVLGVLGNILVLYVYTRKYHPSTYRCFILWLGWIDLVACTVGMPLLIVSMLFPYMFPSEAACKTLRFLHVFFVVASAFIVITIAIERHRRICNPFSPEMSTRKIKIMCAVASILGCIVALPAIFVYGGTVVETGVNNINGTECFIDPRMKDSSFPKAYFALQLLLSVSCMVVMGIFYFRIGRTIMAHHKFIRENTYNARGPLSGTDQKRKTKESFAEPDSDIELVNDTNRDTDKQNGATNGNAPNSRENSPARYSLDNFDSKKDPYGELLRKVVKDNSRSNSPKSDQQTPESGESTPQSQRKNRGNNRLATPRRESITNRGPSLRTKQVTLMLFIITVVFVLSFIPHLILMVTISFKSDFLMDMSPIGVAVYNIFLRSFVINNMANPIIYGFCDKKFRSECSAVCLSFFCWCFRR